MSSDYYNLKVINWLSSYPKSGNTWIRFLFQAHQEGNVNLNANSRVTFSDGLRWPYAAVAPWELNTIPLECIPHLRGAALMLMMASKSGDPFVCKTHCANTLINKTRLIPYELTKTSVYLVRDPRDIVVSYANHFQETFDHTIMLMGAKNHVMGLKSERSTSVPQYPASWSINVNSWTEDLNFEAFGCAKPLVIRYEDMLEDPKKYFLKILKLWEVRPKNVDKAIQLARFSSLKRQEKRTGFLENKFDDVAFFNKGKSGNWKGKLSKSQLAQIVNDHGAVMEKMGYL